ncbi:MAG: spore coat U domain-containing protein, partial [Gammaproteobacteria bacterium]
VMNVGLAVEPACAVSVTDLNFGTVINNSGSPQSNATAVVTVNCAANVAYNVSLDQGQNFNNSFGGSRNLRHGQGGLVPYGLYKDAAYTMQWGDSDLANTYPQGTSLAATGTGADQAHTVYGTVNASNVSPGALTDAVNVIVDF